MMTVKFIALPVLVLLIFAAFGVIVLFLKLGSKRKFVAGIAALSLVLLFISVLVLRLKPAVQHLQEVTLQTESARYEETASPIWQPGIEDEFEADVYSSRLSAVRSVGLRIAEPVRQVFGEIPPSRIIVFRGAHDDELLEQFGQAVSRAFDGIQWTIAPETIAVQKDEVGIRLDLVKVQTHPAQWLSESENEITSGTIQASVLAAEGQASIRADFVNRPWIDDFSGFLNTQPKRQFIVAKSADSCTTEAEANRQAIQDACAQVGRILGRISQRLSAKPLSFVPKVNSDDLFEGDLVLDRFVQSFKGTAGRIWRQAFLIDVSSEKLTELAERKMEMAQVMRTSWARMFLSVLGLLMLITVVYAFLNAATKGYYTWSLRLAGAVLAAVVIILFLV